MKQIPILYENDEILLINKAAGVAVQGGEKIVHPLDAELSLQEGYKVYLVHRLDRETAGILVVAKNPAAAAKWTKLIGSGRVTKEYRAVCVGIPNGGKTGTITEHIVQHGQDKCAITQYKVLSTGVIGMDDDEDRRTLSLLSLTLGTGRMHQIRIHLAKIGCPIAGDDRHGDFKANKLLRKTAGIKRLMLASCRLTLPLGNENATFTIPLPDYMQRIIDKF